MKFWFRYFTVFLMHLLLLNGCHKTNETKQPNLIISNWGGSCEYLYYLNNEPISGAKGMSVLFWHGFPLQNGNNELTVILEPLSNTKKDICKIQQLSIEAYPVNDDPWIKDIELEINKAGNTVHSFTFQYQGIPEEENSSKFSAIEKNQSTIDIINKISFKLINAFAKKKLALLDEIIIFNNNNEKINLFPNWYLQAELKDLKITRVQNLSDIDILFGEKTILVKPSKSFLQQYSTESLFHAEYQGKDIFFPVSIFLFHRINNEWFFKGSLGILYPIKIN